MAQFHSKAAAEPKSEEEMVHLRSYIAITAIALTWVTQGCAFAPKPPDTDAQQAAVERWNLCLQRFEHHSKHYCNGHRRDIIASFPLYLESQVHDALVQQKRTTRASKFMKAGLGQLFDASDNPAGIQTFETPSKAQSDDL